MRTLLVVATLCLVALAVPATTEAHVATCNAFDVACIAECSTSHETGPSPGHECRVLWPVRATLP